MGCCTCPVSFKNISKHATSELNSINTEIEASKGQLLQLKKELNNLKTLDSIKDLELEKLKQINEKNKKSLMKYNKKMEEDKLKEDLNMQKMHNLKRNMNEQRVRNMN